MAGLKDILAKPRLRIVDTKTNYPYPSLTDPIRNPDTPIPVIPDLIENPDIPIPVIPDLIEFLT